MLLWQDRVFCAYISTSKMDNEPEIYYKVSEIETLDMENLGKELLKPHTSVLLLLLMEQIRQQGGY
jgi:hypothetical protein